MSERVGRAQILAEAPRNCWVALNQEETIVVGHGEMPETALSEAKSNGVDDPLLVWAPDNWVPRVL